MVVGNGGHRALRAAGRLIDDQLNVIVGLRNSLRHRCVSSPLNTSLSTASITGIDLPNLNSHALDLYSRLCCLLSQRFLDVIYLGSTAGTQVLSLRINSIGSSSSGISPSKAR